MANKILADMMTAYMVLYIPIKELRKLPKEISV